MPTDQELHEKVNRHDRALFGDPDNLKDYPGLMHEQRRTNELLEQIVGSIEWIKRLALGAIVSAILALVIKGGVPGTQ